MIKDYFNLLKVTVPITQENKDYVINDLDVISYLGKNSLILVF